MTNRFGVDLYPKEVRWAAAEGVSEDIIAAVLLLHHSSVDEIAPQLSAAELGKVIELVGPRARPRRAARRELHREAPGQAEELSTVVEPFGSGIVGLPIDE